MAKINQPIASYEITKEITISRIKHRVNFWLGESVGSLIDTLQRVPPKSTLDDSDYYDDSDWLYLEFHEEKICG